MISAAALIGSLYMTWYQLGLSYGLGSGAFAGISLTALGEYAGGWRFAILIFAIATIAEVVANLVLRRVRSAFEWPHRSLLPLLAGTNLVLVLVAFFDSPLGPASGAYGLLNASPGGGAYLGLVAAVVGVAMAGARLVTEPSTFRR